MMFNPKKETPLLSLQFLTRFPQYPCVVWCDLMKCGRLTQQEVNDYCDLMHSIFKKSPMSVAVLVAPYLVSEKVAGYRGELRTFGMLVSAHFRLLVISILL